MDQIIGLIKKYQLTHLLGVAGLAVLIWRLGPRLWEPLISQQNRWIAILCLFVMWGLIQMVRLWIAKRREKQIQEELKDAPPDPALHQSQEEIATLEHNFDEALKDLKDKLGHRYGRQYVYELPWYIIIGRSKVGKTTIFRTADLNFQRKVEGIGRTQACNWFFTDEAVLLDTAGRYLTQENEIRDSAGWQGFLDLLKKHRRRRPINGALIAISVEDLLQPREDERINHARTIRKRVQELHDHLGIRFPVYVLFTKCDLLPGFVEFFEDLGGRDRAQVWGVTLPLYSDPHTGLDKILEDIVGRLADLENRLQENLLRRLQNERNSRRRDLIYNFPQQFRVLKSRAEPFLREILLPNMRKETVFIRGVYFTSGTQEGAPIDQVLRSLAKIFELGPEALSEFAGEPRSYFVTRLLREIIFKEENLASANLRLENRLAWLQRGAYATALILTGLLIAAWISSYGQNKSYITQVKDDSETLMGKSRILSATELKLSSTDLLELLDSARDLPGGHGSTAEYNTWQRDFGLSQVDDLGAEGIDVYQRMLKDALLPRLKIDLEKRLQIMHSQTPLNNPDELVETSRVYLMLDKDRQSPFDAYAISDWWRNYPPDYIEPETKRQLLRHLEALGSYMPGRPDWFFSLDNKLVTWIQGYLQQHFPLKERIYRQLKQERSEADKKSARKIGDIVGWGNATMFEDAEGQSIEFIAIPTWYTVEGYQRFIQEAQHRIPDLADKNRIIGNPSEDLQQLQMERSS